MHAATPAPSLPEDAAALRAMLLAVLEQRDTLAAERDAAVAQNERLLTLLAKLRRMQFGRKSERLPEDQLLFAFEEIEATLAEGAAEAGKQSPTLREQQARRRRANRGHLPAHLPLNRQSESFAREGIELDVSTLADWVGACTATLSPLVALLRAHVLAGERLHGDDTTVPVLATGRTTTGRLWVYVRDDRPFAGPAPPAALFHYTTPRGG